MMKIILPKLTGYQQAAYDWFGDAHGTGKIVVLKAVRQCGKTIFCLTELLREAMAHPGSVSAIYEPTLNQSRGQYKRIVKALEGTGLLKIANGSLLEVELTNGSSILFKSTEQSSRSYTITGMLVLDECAYLNEDEVYSVLQLVNAHNAPIIIASTPFMQSGYYYDMFVQGNSGKPNIRTFDWSREKEVERFLTPERKEFYRGVMSRNKFRTECLGEFLTADGLLFTNLDACIHTPIEDESDVITIGIDFSAGKENDFTVISAMNGMGHQIGLWRTNNLTPMQQVDWIVSKITELNERYTIRSILGEVNSIGAVYNDALNARLKSLKLKVTDWVTSNKSKQNLVTLLQIALERGEVKILDNPILLDELRKYEATVNEKTHTISYNGAKGSHDDTVIATMLSYWALKKNMNNGLKITLV